jgi:hypothetical protein
MILDTSRVSPTKDEPALGTELLPTGLLPTDCFTLRAYQHFMLYVFAHDVFRAVVTDVHFSKRRNCFWMIREIVIRRRHVVRLLDTSATVVV